MSLRVERKGGQERKTYGGLVGGRICHGNVGCFAGGDAIEGVGVGVCLL